jgi:O-antigen/teichoic acid export membrane protein
MLYLFIPFFVFSLLFAGPIFKFFFNDKFLGVEKVFVVFAFSGIIRSFGNPQGALLAGVGLIKYDSYQMFGCILLNILLNIILIPKYGAIGAAYSMVLALLFGTLLKEYFIRKYYFSKNIL